MGPFFRKKPVAVEARQVKPAVERGLCQPHGQDWLDLAAWCNGKATFDALGPCILIDTLEGQMRASPGDWIVKGTSGEFYPVKDAIFAKTYEQATKEDLDTIGARQAFDPDPSLADMARLARLLGCTDKTSFIGKVLKAMGGKVSPALVGKAWVDAQLVAEIPSGESILYVVGGRPMTLTEVREIAKLAGELRAKNLQKKGRIARKEEYPHLDLTKIEPGTYSCLEFLDLAERVLEDAEMAAGIK